MKVRLCVLLSVLIVLASACTPQPAVTQPSPAAPAAAAVPSAMAPAAQPTVSGSLNVFAAASLTDAFNEIGKAFEAQHPGVTIAFNYAGSQQLAQQIASGAPVDVFASANLAQMNAAAKSGRIEAAAEQNFAQNRLVVIYPKANPGGIQTLQGLAKPGLKLVLADPSVPVGQYALSFLATAAKDASFGAGYKDAVLQNVVSNEQDVKAVLTKVELGEADAGIVYTTDAATDRAGKTAQLAIPDALNAIGTYPIAPINDSQNPGLAKAFVAYVLSADGQKALTNYGFIPVNQ